MHEASQIVGVEVVFQDISHRKAMEAELIRLATTDSLTGMANRRHFQEQLETELTRIKRFGKPAALLMVDIGYSERINDTYREARNETQRALTEPRPHMPSIVRGLVIRRFNSISVARIRQCAGLFR